MATCLFIQQKAADGENFMLIVHEGLTAPEAMRLTSLFHGVMVNDSSITGEMTLVGTHRARFALINDLYIVVLSDLEANPFIGTAILDTAIAMIMGICRNVESVIVPKLAKRYGDLHVALSRVLAVQGIQTPSLDGDMEMSLLVPIMGATTSMPPPSSKVSLSHRACALPWHGVRDILGSEEGKLHTFATLDCPLPLSVLGGLGTLSEPDLAEDAIWAFPDAFLPEELRQKRPERIIIVEEKPIEKPVETPAATEAVAVSLPPPPALIDSSAAPTLLAPPPTPVARRKKEAEVAWRVREAVDAVVFGETTRELTTKGEISFSVRDGQAHKINIGVKTTNPTGISFLQNPECTSTSNGSVPGSMLYVVDVPADGSFVTALRYKQVRGLQLPLRCQTKWSLDKNSSELLAQIIVNPVIGAYMTSVAVACVLSGATNDAEIDAYSGDTSWVPDSKRLLWTVTDFSSPARLRVKFETAGEGQMYPLHLRFSSSGEVMSAFTLDVDAKVVESVKQCVGGRFHVLPGQ